MFDWLKREKICKHCRHFRAAETEGSGLCVRRAPVAVVIGDRVVGAFPRVRESDGCSEWNRPTGSFWDM